MNFPSKLTFSLLACLLFIAACGNAAKSGNLMASADPREDLVKAMKALSNAKSYRSKLVITASVGVKGEAKTVMDIEFVAPDRYRAIAESNLGTRGNVKGEFIILGNDTYMKIDSGQWQKTQKDMREGFAQLKSPNIEAIASAEVKFIGNETLDGLPTLVYQHAYKNAPSEAGNSTTKTWVGVNDGLPHKIEVQTKFDYQGQTYITSATTAYYDYNTDIKIEPPL
jgi:outer membrane lipoprotein-sorting protein